MDRNNLFPIFLKLDTLHTLVVGGGNVGLEKLSGLLKNSPTAKVTLIAGNIRDEVRLLAVQHPAVKLIERNVRLFDLWNKDLIILATDNRALHTRLRKLARFKRILINVADTPDLCDFYLGAVVTKGNLKIGISTNGKSPTIAKRMREFLEESIPENTNDLLDNMQKIRAQIKGDFNDKVNKLNEITTAWLKDKKP